MGFKVPNMSLRAVRKRVRSELEELSARIRKLPPVLRDVSVFQSSWDRRWCSLRCVVREGTAEWRWQASR